MTKNASEMDFLNKILRDFVCIFSTFSILNVFEAEWKNHFKKHLYSFYPLTETNNKEMKICILSVFKSNWTFIKGTVILKLATAFGLSFLQFSILTFDFEICQRKCDNAKDISFLASKAHYKPVILNSSLRLSSCSLCT